MKPTLIFSLGCQKKLIATFAIAIIQMLLAAACKKENNSHAPGGSGGKVQIHFVDFATGAPASGLLVEVGYRADSAFVTSQQLKTDNNGNCNFVSDEYSVLVKPVSDLYYDLADTYYYSLTYLNKFNYFSLERRDGNKSFYLARLFRKARSRIHIRSYSVGDVSAGYRNEFLLKVTGYDLSDTLQHGRVVQSPQLMFQLQKQNGILVDTTFEIQVYGDIYNRMEWSVTSWHKADESPYFSTTGITPAKIFKTGVNDEILVTF